MSWGYTGGKYELQLASCYVYIDEPIEIRFLNMVPEANTYSATYK